jgi:hypothetical protein
MQEHQNIVLCRERPATKESFHESREEFSIASIADLPLREPNGETIGPRLMVARIHNA